MYKKPISQGYLKTLIGYLTLEKITKKYYISSNYCVIHVIELNKSDL